MLFKVTRAVTVYSCLLWAQMLPVNQSAAHLEELPLHPWRSPCTSGGAPAPSAQSRASTDQICIRTGFYFLWATETLILVFKSSEETNRWRRSRRACFRSHARLVASFPSRYVQSRWAFHTNLWHLKTAACYRKLRRAVSPSFYV